MEGTCICTRKTAPSTKRRDPTCTRSQLQQTILRQLRKNPRTRSQLHQMKGRLKLKRLKQRSNYFFLMLLCLVAVTSASFIPNIPQFRSSCSKSEQLKGGRGRRERVKGRRCRDVCLRHSVQHCTYLSLACICTWYKPMLGEKYISLFLLLSSSQHVFLPSWHGVTHMDTYTFCEGIENCKHLRILSDRIFS